MPARRPRAGWRIEDQPDGRVDLWHAGRPERYDLDDVAEALRHIRSTEWAGESIVHVYLDGYAEPIAK